MAVDAHYIPIDLGEMVFLDKDSGQPLSGGLVYFYRDSQPLTLKPMYQITGTSPAYTYTELDNPMVLSSIGTFVDDLGNPIIPYYYPWLNDGITQDLYAVVVQNSGAVPQYTRVAMPFPLNDTGPGPTPPGTATGAYTNQISNPEFSQVFFDTSSPSYTYNFMAGASQVVNIAPNWDIIVTCSGAATVTVKQSDYPATSLVPYNPGTLLNISSGGVTALRLRQRIYGSPGLWSGQNIAASFVCQNYAGSSLDMNLYYTESNGTTALNQLIASKNVAPGNYVTVGPIAGGSVAIPVSDNTDTYPNAYIDIYFDIPVNTQWDISTVMVTPIGSTVLSAVIPYDQASPYRQTDRLYHFEYPIVPVGTVIDFAGYTAPLHYFLCNGATKDRIQYQQLLRAITLTDTVTFTATMATYTDANAPMLYAGMAVESSNVAGGTTILSISGTTVTLSANATASGAFPITYFPFGNGDGSTTFTIPNLLGKVIADVGGSLLGAASAGHDGLGQSGGNPTYTLLGTDLPNHTHDPLSPNTSIWERTPGAGNKITQSPSSSTDTNAATTGGISGFTSQSAFGIIQPTVLLYKYIRYE